MSGTIIVIDDDPDFVDLVRALLRDRYVIEGCTNSWSALDRVHQIGPVLVFLDLHMPSPNGWELLKALRDDPACVGLPILLVSADEVETVFDESLVRPPAGPIGVLSKPFEIDDLLEKVARLVGRGRRAIGDEEVNSEACCRVGITR